MLKFFNLKFIAVAAAPEKKRNFTSEINFFPVCFSFFYAAAHSVHSNKIYYCLQGSREDVHAAFNKIVLFFSGIIKNKRGAEQ